MSSAPTNPISPAPRPPYAVLFSSPAASPAPPPMPEAVAEVGCDEYRWTEWHGLRFVVRLKQEYCRRRAWYLTNITTSIEVVGVVVALMPLYFVVASPVATGLTVVILLLTVTRLRSKPEEEARRLRERLNKLNALAVDMEKSDCFKEANLAEYRSALEGVLCDEFPIDEELERAVHNSLVRKLNQPELSVSVDPVNRLRIWLLYPN